MRRTPYRDSGYQLAPNRFRKSLRLPRIGLVVLSGLAAVSTHFDCANSNTERTVMAAGTRRACHKKAELTKTQAQSRDLSDSIPEKSSETKNSEILRVSGRDELSQESDTSNDVPAPSMSRSAGAALSTQPISSTYLTLAELETLALQNNPTLAQAQAGIAAQQGDYRQAGLYPNPQVGYLNGSASNPSVKQSNGLFVSQELVTAHKLDLAQQSVSQEIKRYQWDMEAQRMRVLNDLKIRYYEVLGAQEAVAVAKKLVQIADESLALTEKMLKGNQGPQSDVLQAKVQLETSRLSVEDSEHRYAAAWKQLATIIGISPMRPVPLAGSLENAIPQLDFETRWQELLASSPQLRSTESELDHGRATYREALAQAIPNVTLQTVAEYDRATQATTVSTLVALPLPIYNRNQGNIDKASAEVIASQAEICRVQLVLYDQLAESFRRYDTSLGQSERLKKSILPNAEENLRLAQRLYSSGESSFAPALLAQQSYFQSQIAYVEALIELHKVAAEIEGFQLTGGLNPAAIGSAIQNQSGGGAQRQRALLNDVQDRASKQLLPAAQVGR